MIRHILIYIVIFLGIHNLSYSQNYNTYDEVGIMSGPVFFKSDFGERGNFENFYKNNGFSLGVFYYVSAIDNYNSLKEHFKLRLEASYMKCDLQHYGIYVDSDNTSLFANQLRAMKGIIKATNIGFQTEYYPFRTDDYNRGVDFSPYISLGAQLSLYSSKIYSDLGPLGTPITTPIKYLNGYRNDNNGVVASLTSSIGTRYRLSDYNSLVADFRLQYYFSDWVDGLNPNRQIYTENKYNDWSVTLNIGYVYYFN